MITAGREAWTGRLLLILMMAVTLLPFLSLFVTALHPSGTYPAGRFVALTPAGGGRYRLDFNRARNPFCAYSSAYACPAPWRGNALPARIAAGEQYHPTK